MVAQMKIYTGGRRSIITRLKRLILIVLCVISVEMGISAILPSKLLAADTPIQQVLPFNRPRVSDLRASPRKAFAYWYVYPVSIDNADPSVDWYQREELSPLGRSGAYYAVGGRMRQRPLPRPVRTEADGVWQVRDMEDEIRRATEVGLDGFMVGLCTLIGGHCWEDVIHLLKAANNIDRTFKIIPTLDMAALFNEVGQTNTIEGVVDALVTIADNPAVFRGSGDRMVVAATNAQLKSPGWWQDLRQRLAARGVGIHLTLILQTYEANAPAYAPVAEALGSWGPATAVAADATAARTAELRQVGKTYVAPVRPQDHRPKNAAYAEALGSATYRATLMDAIDGDADWLFIFTWNDDTEGATIRPSTGIQWSFYDMTAYYLTWFKLRQPPVISRDVLYYFHRVHWTSDQPDPAKQPSPFALWYSSQQAATDEIELLAFLRSAGTLTITTGNGTFRYDAPAGISSFRAPLATGYPTFKLLRGGTTQISMTSAFRVRHTIDWQDLLYRGGGSKRPVVDMVANPPIAP